MMVSDYRRFRRETAPAIATVVLNFAGRFNAFDLETAGRVRTAFGRSFNTRSEPPGARAID